VVQQHAMYETNDVRLTVDNVWSARSRQFAARSKPAATLWLSRDRRQSVTYWLTRETNIIVSGTFIYW